MACMEEEFLEMLSEESSVDLLALSQVAKHGIPDSVRGEVWKYLLGVARPDKSKEMKLSRNQSRDYAELEKTGSSEDVRNISQELKRYGRFLKDSSPSDRKKFESITLAYVNNNSDFEYTRNGTIYLIGPFVYLFEKEAIAYFCFDAFASRLTAEAFSADKIAQTISVFLMLCQAILPDLITYMEDEEVSPNDWAVSWFQFLLSKELPFDCLLRLWDTYLSCADGFKLHFFVSIAIVAHFKEELMELEQSELKGFLQHLPSVDMDQIITQAYNLKDELGQKGLL